MAHPSPEQDTGTNQTGNSSTGNSLPEPGRRKARGGRFLWGTLAGFVLAGVLFFCLLALWSILAGPFVRLQSASFVVVGALMTSVVITVWLYRAACRR